MAAAAVLGGIGLASSIGGQIMGGVSRANQAEAEYKASSAAGQQDVVSTEFEIGKVREQAARVTGAQIAGYGRGGVVLEGSPLRQIVETAQRSEEDVFWKRYNLKQRVKQRALGGKPDTTAAVVSTAFGVGGSLLTGITNLPGVF